MSDSLYRPRVAPGRTRPVGWRSARGTLRSGGEHACFDRGTDNRRGAVWAVRGHRACASGGAGPRRRARARPAHPGPRYRDTAGNAGDFRQGGCAWTVCSRNRCTWGSPGSSTRTSGRWARLAFAGAGCQWEFQCSLPQWRTEQILADRVVELGGTVERGVEAVSVRAAGRRRAHRAKAGGRDRRDRRGELGHRRRRRAQRDAGIDGRDAGGHDLPGHLAGCQRDVACGLPRDGSALIASPEGWVLLVPASRRTLAHLRGGPRRGRGPAAGAVTRRPARWPR